MCGIVGGVNFTPDINFLYAKLKHRGPDDSGSFKYKNIFLFHTRLAIQDIKHGKQPFVFQDYVVVYNGEIYNHIELKEQYLKEFKYTTNSDTETLLYLYIKFKENMFDKLDGMFSFAIFDKKNNIIFLARDRAGKKPLYYYKDKDIFFFASELNLFTCLKSLQIDESAILTYLRCGFFPFNITPFKNVKKVMNGSYLILNLKDNSLKEKKYFNILKYYQKEKIANSEEEIIENLEEKISKSVKDRLLASDLEVGAFLSGGIDSSLIVAFASKFRNNLKTFTVKFEGEYDESPLARLTAERYGTDHTEIEISINLKNDVEKILKNYGMPFMDSSAIPSFYVSKEAKKYLTVILNGDGADELFAGYRRYVPVAYNFINLARKLNFLLKVLPVANEKKSIYNYIYRLLAMSNKKGLDFYLSATNDIFEDVYFFENNEFLENLDNFILNIFNSKNLTELSKFLYLDFELILFCDLLIKMDIATMANSLEGRSPFLSKYILEFAPQIPDHLKINKITTKYILRKLGEKCLPKELINQPKRGFEVPLKRWVNNDLKDMIFDALKKGCYSENFINRKFINNLLEKKIKISEEKRAKILWTMFCLEVWKNSI